MNNQTIDMHATDV